MTTQEQLSNWSQNIALDPKSVLKPDSIQSLIDNIISAHNIRAIGTAKSFNKINSTTNSLIVDLGNLPKLCQIDKDELTCHFSANLSFREVCEFLEENNYEIVNLASNLDMNVIGTMQTASHGSGIKNGICASILTQLEIVNSLGDIEIINKEDHIFSLAAVSIGLYGVICSAKIKISKKIQHFRFVVGHINNEDLLRSGRNLFSIGQNVSIFTNFKDSNKNQIWVKGPENQRIESIARLKGLNIDLQFINPKSPGQDSELTSSIDVFTIFGSASEIYPHLGKLELPIKGKDLQSEFYVPIECYEDFLRLMYLNIESFDQSLRISEIRFLASDNFMMSPAYKRPVVGFHFTWRNSEESLPNINKLEDLLISHFGTNLFPHWGKLFDPNKYSFNDLLPKEFWEIAKTELDIKFKNNFLKLVIT